MIKRIIVTIFILCLTNLSTMAECVTGYACSIKDLQESQSSKIEENSENLKNKDVETAKNNKIFKDKPQKDIINENLETHIEEIK